MRGCRLTACAPPTRLPCAGRIAFSWVGLYRRRMPRSFVILLCGVMLAMNAVSCDMLLPGFFAMQADFGVPMARVQAVVPIFLASAAIGQIVFGPASDRFGRKPVLLTGLVFYLAGSLLGYSAGSIEVLYGARVLQGVGAACAVVLARAILRDTHSGSELARAMALAMAIFAIGPLLAPLTGVGLIALGGWRATFAGLFAVGLALAIAALVFYRETNAAPDAKALSPARLVAAFAQVLMHPQSRHFLLVSILLQVTVVLLVVNAPLLYRNAFGVEGVNFALAFAVGALGIVIGQLGSNRIIARIGVLATLRGATALLLATVAVSWLTARSGYTSAALFTALLFVFNLSFLVVFTNGISLVLDPHRTIAGVASALLGCTTQLAGNLGALALMPYVEGELATWALAQLVLVAMITVLVMSYRPQPAAAVAES